MEINLLKYLSNNDLIEIKLDVPQVGSKNINFEDLIDNYLYDFIIDINGYVKFGHGHYKLNHKQKYLYFAGRTKIKNKQIIYIDNDSGHYYPNKEQLEKLILSIKQSNFISNNIEYKFIDLDSFFIDLI